MHPIITIALRAAHDAAEAIAHSSDRLDRVKILNDSAQDFLTSMDKDAEKTILYHLQKAHPEHCYHSRVSGLIEGEDKNTVWLIDPLAGSWNFSRGYCQFAVSIACQIDGKVQHAVVINPIQNEQYVASRGQGAQLNSRRLRVTGRKDLIDSLISLNPDADSYSRMLALQQNLLEVRPHIRMGGCTTLDLVAVAAGKTDAGWASMGNPVALTAALLVLQEAGGLAGDQNGNPDLASAKEIVFGNPKCFKQLLQLLP